jgi:hypothetical protein
VTVRIYGQAPSRTSNPYRPLGARSGRKLAALAGITVEELAERAELRNLLATYPGPARAKGDRWLAADAALAAGFEIARWEHGDRIVLLGRKVAAAFRVRADFLVEFSWMVADDGDRFLGRIVECVVLPHPSGVVRFWNDPEKTAAAAEILSVFLGVYDLDVSESTRSEEVGNAA